MFSLSLVFVGVDCLVVLLVQIVVFVVCDSLVFKKLQKHQTFLLKKKNYTDIGKS